MGIGTSMGAYYDDEFHHSAAQWDNKYDENVIHPNKMQTDRLLDEVELDPSTGMGVEVRAEVDDRRSETTVWTVDRLLDPRPLTSIEGSLIEEGGAGNSDIPDPLFPSQMAKDLGIDDMDKLTEKELSEILIKPN
jgi:hypothetical protein